MSTVATRQASPTAVPAPARPSRGGVAQVLAIGVAAAAVAAVQVSVPAPWRDEVATITASTRSWPALLATVSRVDVVHALYYAGMHLWFGLVGYTPFTLRLPSVLAVGATASLVVLLGRALKGIRAGLAAGAACAVLPALTWAGGEGRSYAVSALLAAAATLALVRVLEAPTPGRRIAHAALLALGAAVFLDSALLIPAHLVSAVLLHHGRGLRATLPGAIAAAVVTVPLAVLAAHQSAQTAWIALEQVEPWRQLLVQQWFRSDSPAIAAGAVVVIALLAALLRRARGPRRAPGPAERTGSRLLAIALPWAVLPPLALMAAGLVHAPLYWPRYVTFTAPAVALLLGLACAALRPLTAIAVLALAAAAVPQLAADRQPRGKADSGTLAAAQLITAFRSPADGPGGVVYGPIMGLQHVSTDIDAIAYPAAFRGLVDLTAVPRPDADATLFPLRSTVSAALPRIERLHTVWFVLDPYSTAQIIPVRRLHALGFSETGRFRARGTLLLRWSQPSGSSD